MDLRRDSIRKYKSYNNMKKLFVALVIFLATSVNAQWVQMNVPTTANICCFTKIGTNLFAETRRYSYIKLVAFIFQLIMDITGHHLVLQIKIYIQLQHRIQIYL